MSTAATNNSENPKVQLFTPIEGSSYVDDGTRDYHFCCNVDTPKATRDALYIGDIYSNAATCSLCGEYVRSRNKHDYRSCSCGNLSVDGGSHYCRRSGKPGTYVEAIVLFSDARGGAVA